MKSHNATRGFMSAASPGVIALFFRDDHYGSREKYLAAIADAMRDEYRAIVEAGLCCRSIVRTLRWAGISNLQTPHWMNSASRLR